MFDYLLLRRMLMLGGKKKRGLYIKPNDSSELGYLKRLLKSTARMILTDFEIGQKKILFERY